MVEEKEPVPSDWISLMKKIEVSDLGLEKSSSLSKPFFLGKTVRLKSRLIGKISGLLYKKKYFVLEKTELRDFLQDDLSYRIPPPKKKPEERKEGKEESEVE